MNYKNLLKEQLLSEIILPKREFDPNLLSPDMKLKMRGRKGPDKNIISKLFNRKFQPTKWEQEMSDRPRLTSKDLEKYVDRKLDSRDHYGKIRDWIDRMNRGEFNQSDLGAQSLKPYKKKIGISLGFRKQNPDETIY
jgi:hypothetical protein